MATHTSATMREHTPHAKQTTRTATILDALTRRALAVLNDTSLDAQTRAIIRYSLETNDPWLAQLVKRVEAGESLGGTFEFSQSLETNDIETGNSTHKLEALTEIICRSSDESAAALFLLMAILQNSAECEALANTVKHFAFTRCGELNLNGIVDAQIAFFERVIFSG